MDAGLSHVRDVEGGGPMTERHRVVIIGGGFGGPVKKDKLTRRRFMAASAAASTTMIAAPFVKTAHAAGKLSIGFWDHFVPDANKTSDALIQEWAAKEKVEVTIDYISGQGNKNLLTIAAEAQAKSGHDILAIPTWWVHANSEQLEPMNDIMGPIIAENGEVNGTVKYLGQSGGNWLGVPATVGPVTDLRVEASGELVG